MPVFWYDKEKSDELHYLIDVERGAEMYSKAYVEITNICNKNCSFCPGTVRPLKRLTMEEFEVIAHKLQGVTKYLYFHIMGEPLTHPLLTDFVMKAKELGFHPAITTNGSLLAKRGGELVEAAPYKVNISVHSFEDGSREDYLHYIETCLNFADKASQAGILTVLRLWNRGYDEGRNLNTEERIRQKFGSDWKEGPRGIRIREKLYLEYGDRFQWPDMGAEDRGEQVFCYGLKDQFGVLCDGRVVPCCLDREGAVTLGNLFEEDIQDILNSPRAKAMAEGFRKRKATEELCRKCGYARRFG